MLGYEINVWSLVTHQILWSGQKEQEMGDDLHSHLVGG